jgi:hypothetical protein
MLAGAIFVMDVAVHNVPAENCELMFAVSRDVKTGYFDGFAMTLKTEMTEKLKCVIDLIRKRFGNDHKHVLVSGMHMDNAGEQQE